MLRSSPLSKRRRCSSSSSFPFLTFADPAFPSAFSGPFRDNVRSFLLSFAQPQPPCAAPHSLGALHYHPSWSLTLHYGPPAAHSSSPFPPLLPLLVIEENALISDRPHCDHCRSVGWGHHLISNRRYHFIVPSPEISTLAAERTFDSSAANLIATACATKVCPVCQDVVPPSLDRCEPCNAVALPGGVFHMQNHLLHGLLHCNGYGHLLCVNGREKGSPYASGTELVDLWDRICSMLRARKVTVKDVANKRAMELRLLHCVGYGQSWFGRWGYNFGHGSFGMTQHTYAKAIEAIRGMPLGVMLQHFLSVDDGVVAIVAKYQLRSGEALRTVGDLVRFMMELKARLTDGTMDLNESTAKCDGGTAMAALTVATYPKLSFEEAQHSATRSSCRWSVTRLELATQVILEALKSCEKKSMARQEVRDAARVYIGDTGLLDFVLKSMGNRRVGRYVVRREVNPITKVLEYSLQNVQDIGDDANPAKLTLSAAIDPNNNRGQTFSAACDVWREEVYGDIAYLYRNILQCYKPANVTSADVDPGTTAVLTAIPTAARIISDTKHMVKDYRGEIPRRCVSSGNDDWGMIVEGDEMLRVMCSLKLEELEEEGDQGTNGFGLGGRLMENDHKVGSGAAAAAAPVVLSKEARRYGDISGGEMLRQDDESDALLVGGNNMKWLSEDMVKMEADQKEREQKKKKESTKERWRRRMEKAAAELVVLPPHASVGELKRAAEGAFRDTYYATRGLKVGRIESLEGVDDEDLLFGNMESGSQVVVRGWAEGDEFEGHDIDVEAELWFEGGSESWTVACPCGAAEDDGERMIACDECDVWQHTRCTGVLIADSDSPPPRFICAECAAAAVHRR